MPLNCYVYSNINIFYHHHSTTTTRCLAHRLNLDSDDPQLVCRCHELSRAFIQSLTTKELWNDYGIVDGILVCFLLLLKNI